MYDGSITGMFVDGAGDLSGLDFEPVRDKPSANWLLQPIKQHRFFGMVEGLKFCSTNIGQNEEFQGDYKQWRSPLVYLFVAQPLLTVSSFAFRWLINASSGNADWQVWVDGKVEKSGEVWALINKCDIFK